MYHTIKFAADSRVALERSPQHHLERLLVPAGTLLRVQIKPYVIEESSGPVEVADLFFEDGTATRAIPFAAFTFAD